MRMHAFRGSTMNRVIARSVSHAVNNHYRYNKNNSYSNTSSNSGAESLGLMFFFLLIMLGACSAM